MSRGKDPFLSAIFIAITFYFIDLLKKQRKKELEFEGETEAKILSVDRTGSVKRTKYIYKIEYSVNGKIFIVTFIDSIKIKVKKYDKVIIKYNKENPADYVIKNHKIRIYKRGIFIFGLIATVGVILDLLSIALRIYDTIKAK